MLIKIANRRRGSPRRLGDLCRLINYLFSPQLTDDPIGNRLLGPPELIHLVVKHSPFNGELPLMADDLARQMYWYTQEALVCQRQCGRPNPCRGLKNCLGVPFPASWYAHIIFSFSPSDTDNLKLPLDPHKIPRKWASSSANAIRIARDALDMLGWSGTQPTLFVAHGDRKHIHVHAVVATSVFAGGTWDVFRFSRQQIFEIASICANAFNLKAPEEDASSI